MDRLLTRILLPLITGALINVVQVEPLNVHMEPSYTLQVCEGKFVTIKCFFQPDGQYKVSWHYSQTPDIDCNSQKKYPRFNTESNNTTSTLRINSIKTNDSGWYFCKVVQDIPELKTKCSNGTQVVVYNQNLTTSPNETEDPTTDSSSTNCTNGATPTPKTTVPPATPDNWWIWLALAVGCTVLIVSIAVICIITRKTEEAIYENTKPDEPGCWSWKRNMDIRDLPASKKMETIKPLRKYDTYSSNRNRRP